MIIHIDPSSVSCDHIKQFMFDFIERELDGRLLMAMDNHVLSCEECQVMVKNYELSVDTGRKKISKTIKLPEGFKNEILKSLQDFTEEDDN
ncbi:MAG: zf-HC2 domain-containing protein [Lentisphaeria bacterium]|nr:zf-HC2 domain-containing protein [Lentisphaeria bacterium]NQZ69341.1 zf-HC2 domain-containing protein [Lentisphaeria bacterium]